MRRGWMWTSALALLLGAGGCVRPAEDVEDHASLSSLFVEVRALELLTDPDDPIGGATAVIPWGDRIAVVDGIQKNVKVFDSLGALAMTLGGPGDGPGEFREPVDGGILKRGDLVILDRPHMSLMRFDRRGDFVGATQLEGISANSMGVMEAPGGDGEVLAVAYATRGDGAAQRLNGVHLLTTTGEYLRPLFAFEPPTRPDESPFHAARMGGDARKVAVGRMLSDTVYVIDWASAKVEAVSVAPIGYERPELPRRVLRSVPQLQEWAKGQTLLEDVEVAQGAVVARFSSFDHELGEVLSTFTVTRLETGVSTTVSGGNAERMFGGGGRLFTLTLALDSRPVLREYTLSRH